MSDLATDGGAHVRSARVAAAHEGSAELIVTVAYPGGGTADVSLDGPASAALMNACDATSLDELRGASWESVRDALTISYNRYR